MVARCGDDDVRAHSLVFLGHGHDVHTHGRDREVVVDKVVIN